MKSPDRAGGRGFFIGKGDCRRSGAGDSQPAMRTLVGQRPGVANGVVHAHRALIACVAGLGPCPPQRAALLPANALAVCPLTKGIERSNARSASYLCSTHRVAARESMAGWRACQCVMRPQVGAGCWTPLQSRIV